jgi:hypothetical protein
MVYKVTKQYTLKTVPFTMMRPAALTLQFMCSMVITQVYSKEWEHQGLAMRLYWLKEKTGDMRGMTRPKAVATCTAWYDLAKDIAAVVDEPLAKLVRDALTNVDWLEPAWVYMKEQTTK